MASLNLSSNGPEISKSYQKVVNASLPTGPSSSPTFAQWALFSVSSPLVNAFQQDSGNKESVLKVQSSGEGELDDLIDEFSEGKVQFAYVKVLDPNTGLPKNVLIAWCGEGVPERTKGYFTSHLAVISKFLHGYHVQLTARADGDLTPEGIVQKVGDSSGSKYSAGSGPSSTPTGPQPPTATKPAFTPTRTGGAGGPAIASRRPAMPEQNVDDDGWGSDAPPVTRTQLEKVQSAYQPTRVNMQDLRSTKPPPAEPQPDRDDVVKGGYQPVGKVDIAAIRREAHESGEMQDDRPVPVKGSYEPVGKVDIAAIRSKAQPPSSGPPPADVPATPQQTEEPPAATPQTISFNPAERMTSMPKPKVSNKFGGGPTFPGTKPPLPTESSSKPPPAAAQIGSASRTFADQGGKTPAQQWAEKKARERGEGDTVPSPGYQRSEAPIQSQDSGQGWKSSYTGKQWAPVQTTHTGKSAPSDTSHQTPDVTADERHEHETEAAPQSVSSIRDQLMQQPPPEPSPSEQKPPEVPTMTRPVPVPAMSEGPTAPEGGYEAESQQAVPEPPQQPRSPTPPSPPVRESSPIQVAMPVSRGVADVHEEQQAPPPAMPTESIQQAVPDEQNLEDRADMSRATAQATVGDENVQGGGIRALAQYDYEKAEGNEIELREGEFVTDIEMIDKDWWVGVNTQGERGLFPSNYVQVVEDGQSAPDVATHEPRAPEPAPAPSSPPAPAGAPSGPTAKGLFDYEAAEDNEISFPENARITDIEFPDDDWWFGEYNGKKGLFPANYVQLED